MFKLKRSAIPSIVFSFVFVLSFCFNISCAQNRRQDVLANKIRELRSLIQEKESKGVDVSQAKVLLRKSEDFVRMGKKKRALGSVNRGISLLKDAPQRKVKPEKAQVDPTPDISPKRKSAAKVDDGFIYGLRIDPPNERSTDNLEMYFILAKDLGMSHVKMAILWDIVESEENKWVWKGRVDKSGAAGRRKKGRDKQGGGKKAKFTKIEFDYDYVAELSQKYGISVIPMFLRSKTRETDADGFAKFVYIFVKRYHKSMNIKLVEFQNEPNAGNKGSGGGKHWHGTAKELAKVNTAAYEKVKASYPDIMIGTAGFITGSRKMAAMYTKSFLDSYFAAKPKFDVFMLHDYPKNLSYTQGTQVGEMSSKYHTFEIYRNLLDRYGYKDKSILVSEGNEEKPLTSPGEIATQYIASYVLTKRHAKKCNVIGRLISNGLISRKSIALIDKNTKKRTKQFNVLKHLIKFSTAYPIYSRHISGEMNSENYWLEEFKDNKGKRMWVSFCPLLYETKDGLTARELKITKKTHKYPQTVTFEAGDVKSVKITNVLDGQTQIKIAKNGKITFVVGDSPVICEEQN